MDRGWESRGQAGKGGVGVWCPWFCSLRSHLGLGTPQPNSAWDSFIKRGVGLSWAILCLRIKAFPLVNGKQEAPPEGEQEHQAELERPGGTAVSPLTPQDPGRNSPDDQISASAP